MRVVLALSVLAIGCVPSVPDAVFVCTSEQDCPPNQRCIGGVCHAGAFDGGVPDADAYDAGPPVDADLRDAFAADAGGDADLVIVTGTNTFIDDSTTQVVPIDWTTANFELRYQTSSTTLSDPVFPMPIDDITRGFAGIPQGAVVYARRGTGTYFVTDRRAFHAGNVVAGRPSEPTATAMNTALQLQNLTALDAWQTGDAIELSVSNNGTLMAFGTTDLPTPPATGATTLTELISWSANGTPLVQGTAMMDRLRVFHLAAYTEPGVALATHATEQFLAPSFDLPDDNAAHTISGPFASIALDQTASVMWDAPAYEALRAEVGPAVQSPAAMAQPTRHLLNFQALPNRVRSQPLFGVGVDLAVLATDGATAVTIGALHYASPFTVDSIVRCVFMQNAMLWRIPPATATSPFAPIQTYAQYDERDAAATLTPVVAPPSNPSVNGMPLTGSTNATTGLPEISVSAPIVISWSAPTHLQTPTSYTVFVYEGALNAAGSTRRALTATFEVTTGTSFVVPAGVLTDGRYFHLLVASNWRADPMSIPAAQAITSSSFFHTTT